MRWVIRGSRVRASWKRPRRWIGRKACEFGLIVLDKLFIIAYVPHRGLWPVAIRPRCSIAGPPLCSYPMPEYAVKKRSLHQVATAGAPQSLAALDSTVFGKLPNVVAHCSITRYDDGDPRRPGWFTVKTMGAAWVVQVKDPDAGASLSATASSLDDALALADLLLGSDDAPWEPDPFLKKLTSGKK